MKKINQIEICNIEDKNERLWFSVIKDIIKNVDFGNVELNITVRNKKVVNIAQIRIRDNFNIGA